MEQNPETLLQLLQIKDEITSIVDHNMQSIQLAYENSGINSENIEGKNAESLEILSFVIHEYELKQLSVDNIGKLSRMHIPYEVNLFELVMEQMNEKKAIQKNVEEKEEMIRGYEIELREYE